MQTLESCHEINKTSTVLSAYLSDGPGARSKWLGPAVLVSEAISLGGDDESRPDK